MASMNTRLNIEKLDGNIIQKHGGSKQVPGVEIGVHGVHDEKRVWFEVELQGAQGDREAEVFQEQEKEYQTGWKEQEWVKAQNGLVNGETNVTLLAKVVLYRNMGLNESGEYKKKLTSFQCRCVSCSDNVVRNALTTALAITGSLQPVCSYILLLYIDDMVYSYRCKVEIWITKGLLVKAKGNILVWRSSEIRVLEARIATGLGKRRFPSKVPAQVECAGRIVLTNSDTKEKLLDIVVTLVNRLWV
ncbi:hypothetical protein Tco_1142226 [Tanacetum coccineum]